MGQQKKVLLLELAVDVCFTVIVQLLGRSFGFVRMVQ